MRCKHLCLLLCVALLVLPRVALATPTLTIGCVPLQLNLANQVFPIYASGEPGDAFEGLDLYLYMTGGPSAPVITSVDIIGPGTLFAGNNTGQLDFGAPYQAPGHEVVAYTTTQTGTIGPDGIVAYVTLDTTGVPPGLYSLSLTHPLFGPSVLARPDGTETLLVDSNFYCPEPSTYVLAGLGALGVLVMGRRGRRQVSQELVPAYQAD